MNNKYKIDKRAKTIIKETLSHQIYVQPKVFEFLQTLSIALPIEMKDFDWNNHYEIWTKKFHSKKRQRGNLSFITDKTTAQAIKKLLRKDLQFMFPPKKGMPFDEEESILTIQNIPMGVQRGTPRFFICKILFGNKETIGKLWEHEEFLSKFEETDDIDDLYDYLYQKARHLNKTIFENTGLEGMVLVEKKFIGINPIHLPLFKV